jgi:hypothetical protein
MATIEIRGSPKRVIKIGHKEASELKDEWFRMKEGKRMSEVIDIGEWSGPWSKILSIDLKTPIENITGTKYLSSEYVSSCCYERVMVSDTKKGFLCSRCDHICEIKSIKRYAKNTN